MTEFIIEKVIAWLIPAVCGAILTWCGVSLKKQNAKDKAIADGLQCLLRAELIRTNKEYIEKGYCPIYALESVNRMYKAYHNLGGNDVVTELVEQLKDLPTTEQK